MKGRHFGFLCLLCASWVSTRVLVGYFDPAWPSFRATTIDPPEPQGIVVLSKANHSVSIAKSAPACCAPDEAAGALVALPRLEARAASPLPDPGFSSLAPTVAAPSPTSTETSAPALWVQAPPAAATFRHWQIYAYSYWRNGGGAQVLGLGQYGGGQSGAIATYAVTKRLSLLVRGALAHERLREREIATGLRWSPLDRAALTLTAERRFRNSRGDAFAFYAAGGQSELPLPLKFRLDAYGQAGYVTGTGGGMFFDAQARASREIALRGNMPLKFGGGVWAGGQEGVTRVDIGPTVGMVIQVGEASMRVDADWRFRIAGGAAPASGPALTLSTSF